MEDALHCLASLVRLSLIDHGGLAVLRGRHDGRHLLLLEMRAKTGTVIGVGHDPIGQVWQRRPGLPDHLTGRRLLAGTAGEREGDTGLCIETAGMAVGGESTPRAAQSRCPLPAGFFRAPAAGGCARIIGLSMKRCWAT